MMTSRRSQPARRRFTISMLMLGLVTAGASPSSQESTDASRDAVAEKAFNAGEAARTTGRTTDAIGSYLKVTSEFPTSIWAARSGLEAARGLIAEGKWQPAMTVMQDVRQRFPETREAELALRRNTILHRLRLTPQGQPAFRWTATAVDGAVAQMRRVRDVAVGSDGQVYVAMRDALASFKDGVAVKSERTSEVRGMSLLGDAPVLGEERGIHRTPDPLVRVRVPDQRNQLKDVDIQAIAVAGPDMLLIADGTTKALHYIRLDGSHKSQLAAVEVTRVAVGPQGQVAAIERREPPALLRITIQGEITRVPAQAAGYQLRGPVDVAFDSLGHLYVLERDSVVVFGPTGDLMTVFFPAAFGGFHRGAALDVDLAGRLYVYDEDSEKLQVYQ